MKIIVLIKILKIMDKIKIYYEKIMNNMRMPPIHCKIKIEKYFCSTLV